MLRDRAFSSTYTIAAWVLTGVALVLVLQLHVLSSLLAGMLVYELVPVFAPTLNKRLSDQRAKLIAVGLLSALVVILVTVAIIGAIVFFKSDAGSLSALLAQMAEIIESSRASMPDWIVERIPASPEDLKATLAEWSRTHGKEAGRMMGHIVIGMAVGAMVALHEALPIKTNRPLARELVERVTRLGDAFRRVVFAQVQISLINTLLTGIYLALVLPSFGVNLPFKTMLIVVTFITGLLPVVGNLISNFAIVVVSLSYSLNVAIGSLLFLIVIHKLEYFLNAHIIGSRIDCHAWELLLAMLAMEAAFGISGVFAAPIYYAYLKDEMGDRGLI